MKVRAALASGVLIGLAVAGLARLGAGQSEPTPIGPKWWPSEWGADDQRGAANRLTPERVRNASRLVREGRVYSLGRPYEQVWLSA